MNIQVFFEYSSFLAIELCALPPRRPQKFRGMNILGTSPMEHLEVDAITKRPDCDDYLVFCISDADIGRYGIFL